MPSPCTSQNSYQGCCFLLFVAASAASAQDQYPSRTVKIIVPTSPGAVTDILARALGQAISQSWGQAVIIDNRPGGDETIGVGGCREIAAGRLHAAPDQQ